MEFPDEGEFNRVRDALWQRSPVQRLWWALVSAKTESKHN